MSDGRRRRFRPARHILLYYLTVVTFWHKIPRCNTQIKLFDVIEAGAPFAVNWKLIFAAPFITIPGSTG